MLIAQRRMAQRGAWFLLAAVFVSYLALGGRTASVSAQDDGKKAEEVVAPPAAGEAGEGTPSYQAPEVGRWLC